MAQFQGVNINISGEASSVEVTDALVALNRSMEYQFANLGSDNIGEIGGWVVGATQLTSKNLDVGMSTDNSQAENIRFWAGSASPTTAPFQVYDTGRVVANDITMTGGDIIWGDVPAPSYDDLFGPKPPPDANNTYSELLFNSGIRGFVNVGGTLYLSADYIRAGTISADIINGGELNGVTINVQSTLKVGSAVYLGEADPSNFQKQLWFSSSNGPSMGIVVNNGNSMVINGTEATNSLHIYPDVTFHGSVTGINTTATFG